jgi:hypothetical protein
MKKKIYYIHSAHLDLFWMGNIEYCMDRGSKIIDAAVEDLDVHGEKHFTIESVRFLEYYLYRYPQKKETVRRLLANGQLEASACYTDRLENHYDGESLVRNVLYGKKMLKKLVDMDTEIALHPDLPGLAEQTPQIYKKTGVKYYFFARGYENGARFYWEALDGSRIITYNFPKHYAYYDFDKVMGRINEISEQIESDVILLSCSAGDLGDYGTFQNDRGNRIKLDDMIRRYNDDADCPYELVMGNMSAVMDQMGETVLPVYSGESPCRWGTYGSATNVSLFKQDKRLAALLADAGKLIALCELNHINLSAFSIDHPFNDTASDRPVRRYFDNIIRPSSPAEWLEFAWRLQLITHDHNYGGIDGNTSDFDRYIFKKAAGGIAEGLIQFCTKRIMEADKENGDFCVFNLLNWERTGDVCLSGLFHGSRDQYSVKDSAGNIYPIFHRDDGAPFCNVSIKPMDYETFQFCDPVEEEVPGCSIDIRENKIVLENSCYSIEVDTAISAITNIIDKTSGENLTDARPVGIIRAYEDFSVDVHEELYDRKQLDTTEKPVKAVQYGRDYGSVWLYMETEICSSKVVLKVQISNSRKEFTINPVIYWIGQRDVQLRFQMDLPKKYKTLFYGVPYGIQVFGNYLHDAFPANPTDEISPELFREYREVQGWFAAEGEGKGISVCTDQSSFAFKEDRGIEAILIRNVKSCGDHEVYISNHGEQAFYFTYTSYTGTGVKEDDRFYRRSWELRHPFRAGRGQSLREGSSEKTAPRHPLLQCGGEGILSALDFESGACFARFFSVREKESTISVSRKDGGSMPVESDLLGNVIGTDMNLKFAEIKTVKF